jgi:hypothetical protein
VSAGDIGHALRLVDEALATLNKARGLTENEMLVLAMRRVKLQEVRHELARDRAAIRARLREVTT